MKTIKRSELMEKLGKFLSIENCPSRNGYGSAPNQFELTYENGKVFQSYNSLIGVLMRDRKTGGLYYFTNLHDCSMTTSGYCTRWCGKSAPERRKGLENGAYTLITD